MATAIFTIRNPFQSHLCYLGELLRDLCQKPTPDTRDDFYSAMSIESLASVPAHTVQLPLYKNVRITYGPGATAVFTRLLIGKCDTVKSFSDACKSMSNYLDENYSDSNIDTETSVTHEDIEEFISKIAKDGRVARILSDNDTKIKILLMPAEATADTPGLVYIHAPIDERNSSYTIAIPQNQELTSKQTILHTLLSELSVCFADYQTRTGNAIFNTTCPAYDTEVLDAPFIYCKQTENREKTAKHLKTIYNTHATILSELTETLPPIIQAE